MSNTPAKDLTKEAPRSPRIRIGGFAIIARMIDKGRAAVAETAGDYHFDCPLDNYLFDFKGVKGSDVKELLIAGNSDEEIALWFQSTGIPKTEAEITEWSDSMEAARPYDNPEKKEWFVGVCKEAGVDPATSTLFDFLEADDRVTFA